MDDVVANRLAAKDRALMITGRPVELVDRAAVRSSGANTNSDAPVVGSA
jgi:hypothetical protein